MPASLASGAYRLLAVFESSSSRDTWYRLLQNAAGDLSCDCPAWVFKKTSAARGCPHTQFMQTLLDGQSFDRLGTAGAVDQLAVVDAMNARWHGGLLGEWHINSRVDRFKGSRYLFLETKLTFGTGNVSSCMIGFAEKHLEMPRVYERVAGWCGYTHAADIARLGGFPMAGQQPEYFKVPKSAKGSTRGLASFLQLANKTDLGDGMTPAQRAEESLQFFLGEQLYSKLETNHFLDVSSYTYPDRVYRLRRDPYKTRDRRVRVFEHGTYVKDFCIVRGQDVPEADHVLSVFLGLMSDEMKTISVVKTYNIFSPHSDDYSQREEETLPAVWRARSN